MMMFLKNILENKAMINRKLHAYVADTILEGHEHISLFKRIKIFYKF